MKLYGENFDYAGFFDRQKGSYLSMSKSNDFDGADRRKNDRRKKEVKNNEKTN
ncbi:MAG: hypothetical protein ABIJ17_02365 [Patescibacteria group bacterium]